MTKKTLVLGASEDPARYSYLAIQRLEAAGYPVMAIGRKIGKVGNVSIQTEITSIANIDTVTLYINADIQAAYLQFLINLRPRRVIFNPGTENEGLAQQLTAAGIAVQEACTLVLLATGQY